jgi:hypothetical protein
MNTRLFVVLWALPVLVIADVSNTLFFQHQAILWSCDTRRLLFDDLVPNYTVYVRNKPASSPKRFVFAPQCEKRCNSFFGVRSLAHSFHQIRDDECFTRPPRPTSFTGQSFTRGVQRFFLPLLSLTKFSSATSYGISFSNLNYHKQGGGCETPSWTPCAPKPKEKKGQPSRSLVGRGHTNGANINVGRSGVTFLPHASSVRRRQAVLPSHVYSFVR